VKPDLSTIVGLLVALGFILVGNALEGGHLSSIIQVTAGMIVFGGTIGAVMVSFPMSSLGKSVQGVKDFLFDKSEDPQALLDEIVRYAQKARKEGIIALETEAQNAKDPFFKKAILMVVDGVDSKTMSETLELELGHMEEEGETAAKVFEAGGGYAPTIGIIGAVLGLIHVMSNLSDVAKVGEGIAVAFVATIYGVASANILFLPAANKLKIKHKKNMILREMVMYGALAIQQGQNPKLIEGKLSVFCHRGAKKHAAAAKAGGGPTAKAA
jgi:chemotaxis protein MotA